MRHSRSPFVNRFFAVKYRIKNTSTPYKSVKVSNNKRFYYALGGNRTPILRTGILRAIRCTTRAKCLSTLQNYSGIYQKLQYVIIFYRLAGLLLDILENYIKEKMLIFEA